MTLRTSKQAKCFRTIYSWVIRKLSQSVIKLHLSPGFSDIEFCRSASLVIVNGIRPTKLWFFASTFWLSLARLWLNSIAKNGIILMYAHRFVLFVRSHICCSSVRAMAQSYSFVCLRELIPSFGKFLYSPYPADFSCLCFDNSNFLRFYLKKKKDNE